MHMHVLPLFNRQSQDTVTFLLSTFTGLAILTGLAVRYILMPYLREHLIDPVQRTHEQVTVNGHDQRRAQPTIPDRLDDIQTDVSTLTDVLDKHVTWSEDEHARLDRELTERVRKDDARRERNGET